MSPIFIFIATGIVLYLAVELGTRFCLARWGKARVWQPNSKVHMQMDQEVLPELEEVVRSEANSLGERGDEPRNMERAYRVLVIGGSAAECFYLDKESGWPGVAKKILSTPENLRSLGKEHVHLGNIARAGVGSVALEKMLEVLLPQYEHIDLVLCMVGASDVLRWFSRGAKSDDEESEIPMKDYMFFLPKQDWSWHPKKTAMAAVARLILKSRQTAPDIRERTGKRVASLRLMRQKASVKRKETGDPTKMLNRFATSFEHILAMCQEKADRVVVVRQPWFEKDHSPAEESFFWNAAQGDPFKEDCDTYFDTSMIKQRMSDMDERAIQVCESMKIEHMDVKPALPMSRATFYDFYHYTPAGARLLGEAVADRILGKTPTKV